MPAEKTFHYKAQSPIAVCGIKKQNRPTQKIHLQQAHTLHTPMQKENLLKNIASLINACGKAIRLMHFYWRGFSFALPRFVSPQTLNYAPIQFQNTIGFTHGYSSLSPSGIFLTQSYMPKQ